MTIDETGAKTSSSTVLAPFSLGRWSVYPQSGEIVSDVASLRLEPRAMAVLCELASEPNHTLSRAELIKRIWGNVVVTDDALTRVIYKLRQDLGDDPQQPAYIQTLPKLGYRLVVEPKILTPATSSTPKSAARRGLFVALGLLLLLTIYLLSSREFSPPPEPMAVDVNYSIAVLPFEDFRSAPEDDNLAAIITDELINSLAHLKQLRVVSRTSAFSVKNRSIDVRELGKLLQANSIIEGSIRRSGDQLRVIVQLIDVDSGYHLFSDTIERPPDDIFSYTAVVIPAVIQALKITAGADELARATAVPGNSGAQRLTIQGRFHWHQRKSAALQKALAYFEQAIELAPDYAPAWAGLADTLVFLTLYGGQELSAVKDRAQQAVDKALELDPGLAEAYASAGLLKHHLGQYSQAIENYRQAIVLNPNNAMAHMWAGRSHFASGRFQDAMFAYQRSAALDPISPIIFLNIGMAGLLAGQIQDAEAAYHKSIEFNPGNPYARWALGYLLWSKGDLRAAESTYSEIIDQGLERADVVAQASILALDSGDTEKARSLLEKAQAIDDQNDWVTQAQFSYLLATGQHSRTLFDTKEVSATVLARQALAAMLENDPQVALEKYTAMQALESQGSEVFFDKWDIEWGFSHALYLQQLHTRLGNLNQARIVNDQLASFYTQLIEQGLRTAGTDYIAASMAAVNNNPEQALADLSQAIDRGWSKLWWLKQDPAFETLREHPQYQALVDRLISRMTEYSE